MREQSQAKVLACPGKDGIFDVGLFQHLFRFLVSLSFFAVGEERSLGFGRVLFSLTQVTGVEKIVKKRRKKSCA